MIIGRDHAVFLERTGIAADSLKVGRGVLMTPMEYEKGVELYFRRMGYATKSTAATNDYGVDIFATKGEHRLAIQAKMYGNANRLVNRDVLMHLHGAKDFFDCTGAVIATDTRLMVDAIAVATKLGIEVLTLRTEELPVPGADMLQSHDKSAFDVIWERHVMPLAGVVMENSRGTNTIVKADWSGVERITSNDKKQFIPIDIFKIAIAELLTNGCVTRDYINQIFLKRASSGILLILSQVPVFELVLKPKGLRLSATAIRQLTESGCRFEPNI